MPHSRGESSSHDTRSLLPKNLFVEVFGDLYNHEEVQRRRDPSYYSLLKTKRLVDLMIVMPIHIPYGKLIVNGTHGPNFYEFGGWPPGAQVLFGGSLGGDSMQKGGSAGSSMEMAHTSYDGTLPHHSPNTTKSFDFKEQHIGGLCDVWASFLNVKIGTVYNLSPHMLPTVCKLFHEAMGGSGQCVFYVPIVVNCRGFYLFGQQPNHCAQFGTKGGLMSGNDRSRFRLIRRHVKKFARDVMLTFPTLHAATDKAQLRVRVELDNNCRSSSLSGGMCIVTRQWNPVDSIESHIIPDHLEEMFNNTKRGSKFSDFQLPEDNTFCTTASARVMLGEVRLEYTKYRMVDPRWPDELIISRKILSCVERPLWSRNPQVVLARFVFCGAIEKPLVVYRMTKKQREKLLEGRSGRLFANHLAMFPGAEYIIRMLGDTTKETNDGDEVSEIVSNSHRRKLAYSPASPGLFGSFESSSPIMAAHRTYSSTSTGLLHDTPYSNPMLLHDNTPLSTPMLPSRSLLKSNVASSDCLSPKSYLFQENCRYFWNGGCARGDSCHYLHAAEQTKDAFIDIRDARAVQHPKFF